MAAYRALTRAELLDAEEEVNFLVSLQHLLLLYNSRLVAARRPQGSRDRCARPPWHRQHFLQYQPRRLDRPFCHCLSWPGSSLCLKTNYNLTSWAQVELLKTSWFENCLDPVWDEVFTIPVCHSASTIRIKVMTRENTRPWSCIKSLRCCFLSKS